MRHIFIFPALQVVLISFCLLLQSATAQNSAYRSDRQIADEINKYMAAADEHEKFMGAILVARDGKPIVSKGYGMANVELDAPNTPKTVFRLASLTKQFTAASILLLQERGKLKISDPFCNYLTDCPAAWQPITIKQLLTMTSGVPGTSAQDLGALRGLPVPWDQWMETVKRKPLDFAPGSEFRYGNPGYTLLGFIIEKLSGKSYGDFLDENIFKPLKMDQSGYENPLRIIKNRATGYRQLPGDPITNVPYAEMVGFFSAGGIYSTTEDLLKWDQALYPGKLLTGKSLEEMYTPDKEMLPGKAYAYGVWKSTKHGRIEIAHGGNMAGFITYLARYPEDRVTVIVLSNNGRGSSGKISGVLSSIVFGSSYEMPYERKAVSVESSVLDKYVGEYKFTQPMTTIVVTNESGKLFQKRNTEPKFEMFAESDSKFFLKNEDIQLTFVKDANGAVTGLKVDQGDGTLYEVINGHKVR